jgi:hypothetical protein
MMERYKTKIAKKTSSKPDNQLGSTNQTHDLGHEIKMTPNRKTKKILAKNIFEKNDLKEDRSRLGLIFYIYNPVHETGVIPLKANPKKNIEARFLIKQILMDEIEEKNQ